MNLTNDIYFDGEDVYIDMSTRIIYKGPLTLDEPEYIFMHLGYGLLWENLQEIKLLKGVSGYEADVTFLSTDTAYFCFRSSTGGWDNNEGQNYCITPKRAQLIHQKDETFLPEVPRLKRSYLIRKKIKIAFYRIISFVGKLISRRFFEGKKKNSRCKIINE